MNKEFRNVGWY